MGFINDIKSGIKDEIHNTNYKLNTNNSTLYYNSGKYFTTEQLEKLLDMLDRKYRPKKIFIIESKRDIWSYLFNMGFKNAVYHLLYYRIWIGTLEGSFNCSHDTVFIYIYSQNDDGDNIHSKQLYSLHALLHELRHRWQLKTNTYITNEDDADNFASKFINENSDRISSIMNWKDEWKVEEE